MTSILETAQQVVAENIGWNGEPAGATLIAAALVEAEKLLKLCTEYDQDSMETAMARDEARAFLSRISKEQDNG